MATTASSAPSASTAGPVLTPSPSTSVLRALRWGCLLCLILAVLLAQYLPWRNGAETSTTAWAGIRVCVGVWLVGMLNSSRDHGLRLPIDVLCLTTTAFSSMIAGRSLWFLWYGSDPIGLVRPTAALALMVAVLAAGLTVVCDLLLRTRRIQHGIEPGADHDPVRWWTTSSGTGRRAPAANPASRRSGRTGTPADDPQEPDSTSPVEPASPSVAGRWRTVGAVALLAPCLVLALVLTVLPRTLVSLPPLTHQVAAAVPEDSLPSMPTALPSSVTWTREVTADWLSLDVAAGARGPIILTKNGVEGLSAQDGSTLWRYHQEGAEYSPLPDTPPQQGNGYLVTSPDRRHVAFVFDRQAGAHESEDSTFTVILDTVTGEISGQWERHVSFHLQLTNSAALIDSEAVSLEDGSHLWSLDSIPEGSENHYTGTAGRSTFILTLREPPEGSRSVTGLVLVPDSDPTAQTTMQGVVLDPWPLRHDGFTVADGWVVRRTPDQRLSAANEPSWPTEAANIDNVAAAGSQDGVTAIPLGQTTGLNLAASISSGMLVTYPAYEEEDADSIDPPSTEPHIGWIFDPSTRTAVDGRASAMPAAASTGLSLKETQDDQPQVSIDVVTADGSPGLSIPVPLTSVSAPNKDWDNYPPQDVYGDDHPSWLLRLRVAPGCVVVLLDADNASDRRIHTYRIYGASTEVG